MGTVEELHPRCELDEVRQETGPVYVYVERFCPRFRRP